MKYVFLDAEFNGTSEKNLNVVCFVTLVDGVSNRYWLHNEDSSAFSIRINALMDDGYVFVSYNVESEARALLSLGINPLKAKWIDLYLEYLMLSNHNNNITKGEQLVNGKVKRISVNSGDKGKKGLSAALFKLCGITIDTDHKTKMRDLIISSPKDFSTEDKEAILEYCESDVNNLPSLLAATRKKHKSMVPREHIKTLRSEVYWRAEYAIRTAMMVSHGYPVNTDWVKNLTENIPVLLRECIEDINSQFPNIKPFKWNKSKNAYSMDTKSVSQWVINSPHAKKWETTPTGLISLSLDAWKKFYNYSHDYPVGNFGAQMLRYLNLSQQLRGFTESKGKASFWDYVGSDGMVRPYMNIYGSQSSRSQPSSTSFLFLKTGWMRSLCVPPKGYAIGAIDYSSQEFLLSAICSGDKKMLDAYASGDVYLSYAKGIGLVPPEGTKETHGKERDLCKATVLGLSYMMSEHGLSIDLTEKLEYEFLQFPLAEHDDLMDAQTFFSRLDVSRAEFQEEGYEPEGLTFGELKKIMDEKDNDRPLYTTGSYV